jgi:F0F1-type ATP synthase membrane subunit c/vacuolar-type H+-ATPase subunit K
MKAAMSIVLLILYVAIALWVYAGLGVRQMYRDTHSGTQLVMRKPKFRRRYKRYLLAFGMASALIIIALVTIIINNLKNNNI